MLELFNLVWQKKNACFWKYLIFFCLNCDEWRSEFYVTALWLQGVILCKVNAQNRFLESSSFMRNWVKALTCCVTIFALWAM